MDTEKKAAKNTDSIHPGDVACVTECNEAWLTCNENKPADKADCDKKMSKCVKKCENEKK